MSIIPDLPPFFNMLYTKEDGSLTVNAQLYNDLMYQVLNQLLSSFNYNFNIGLPLPNATTIQITAYALDTTVPIGTLWYNSSLNKLQFKTGTGTVGTVTST